MAGKRGGQRPRKDNRIRIIGGRWRGRKLAFPDATGLRPSGDRVRETLFNWLVNELPQARCLDAFAGSGALGFEALSRGAGEVVMVENNPAILRQLEASREALGADGANLVEADATSWLQETGPPPFDIIFLDPPFDSELLDRTLQALADNSLAPAGCLVYIESASDSPPPLPTGWTWIREKTSGDVHYGLAVVN